MRRVFVYALAEGVIILNAIDDSQPFRKKIRSSPINRPPVGPRLTRPKSG